MTETKRAAIIVDELPADVLETLKECLSAREYASDRDVVIAGLRALKAQRGNTGSAITLSDAQMAWARERIGPDEFPSIEALVEAAVFLLQGAHFQSKSDGKYMFYQDETWPYLPKLAGGATYRTVEVTQRLDQLKHLTIAGVPTSDQPVSVLGALLGVEKAFNKGGEQAALEYLANGKDSQASISSE